MKLAVVVGRFQVDELTMGHKMLIKAALEYDKVLILAGTSPLRNTRRNPLPAHGTIRAVSEFVNQMGAEERCIFRKLDDCSDDDVWSENLDKMIQEQLIEGMTPILLGGRESFIDDYTGKYESKMIDDACSILGKEISATLRRKELACSHGFSKEFRHGVIWAAYNRFPVVYSTVDIIPFDTAYNKILVGRKKDETKWRFIGGFVDIVDESLVHAATRELYEETNLAPIEDQMEYIDSLQVQDWRYKHETDVVMTHIFTCDISHDTPITAGDDIEEVKWMDFEEGDDGLYISMVIPSHWPIFQKFKKWIVQNG